MACSEAIPYIVELFETGKYTTLKGKELTTEAKAPEPTIRLAKEIEKLSKKVQNNLRTPRSLNLEVTAEAGYTPNEEYSTEVVRVVSETVKPLVREDQELALKAVLNGVDGLIAGQYDPNKHEVSIAIKPNRARIEEATTQLIDNAYYTYISDLDIEDKNLYEYMESDPVYKDLKGKSKEVADSLVEKIDGLLSTASTHAVTHEFIHAGAVNFMRNNPEHEATKRIHEMFKKAKMDRYKHVINKNFVEASEQDMNYWRTSVDEFLAEALSNPMLMAGLNEIEIEADGKLSTVFKEIFDKLLAMLGFTSKESIYQYTLDGYLAMIEAQKDANEVELSDPKYVKIGETLNSQISRQMKEDPTMVGSILKDIKDC